MAKKVLVVYYSQTGQLREIVDSVTESLSNDEKISVTYEELKPDPTFPFPWTADQFFQAMPESVKGIPCNLMPLQVNANENFDLIIIAWQPWFLSPSLPIHAFMQHPYARRLISGKPVITIVGSRNMWLMAQNRMKDYIRANGSSLVGNILLFDRSPNLLSVISIIRWMFKGKRDRYLKFIPPAGVSQADIHYASNYGLLIKKALLRGDYTGLNEELVKQGAIDVNPSVVMMEKRGIILFRIWADFILKKGNYGDQARVRRVRLFKYYLIAVLYLVSPIATVLYALLKPFRRKTIKKQISLYQSTG